MASKQRDSDNPLQAEKQDMLRRLMVRLTVIAEEQNADLSRLMQELRQLLRQPGVDTELLDDVLSQAEKRQDEAAADSDRGRESIVDGFHQLTRQLRDFNGQSTPELDQLDHGLELRVRDSRELSDYLQEFGAAQKRVLERLAGLEQGHRALNAAEQLQRGDTEPTADTIRTMTNELFVAVTGLANRIQLPMQQQTQLQTIIQDLNRTTLWPQLIGLLNQLIELIVSVLNDEQRALEQYLGELNERLSLIRSSVQHAKKLQDDFQQDGKRLDARIQGHVNTIRREMSTAVSLDRLKTGIQSELDDIVSSIDDFLRESAEKERSMANMMSEMVDIISDLEKKNQSIRDDFERTRRQALTDLLTGLPNRSAYVDKLETEVERFRRYGHPLSLCVLDVDHFKRVNDLLGHSAGDRVLKILARQLRRWMRDTDFISRHGGEEFVILLPETGLEEAAAAMEKLRLAVSETPFHFRRRPVPISVSIGCAEFRAGEDPEDVFDRADQAMYRAKEAGRNRVLTA